MQLLVFIEELLQVKALALSCSEQHLTRSTCSDTLFSLKHNGAEYERADFI